MSDLKECRELALMLQNSNVVEVSKISRAYLALEAVYFELVNRHTKMCADEVMRKHGKLLKRLSKDEEE